VRCATEIQRAMAERKSGFPEHRRIEFRIGINVGDIIIDEGDIYGDGVNILPSPSFIANSMAIRRYVLSRRLDRSRGARAQNVRR
jgi:hypothetical protein